MKERILAAVDGSANSLDALKEAVNLANVFDYELILVNVQPSFNMIHTRLFINEELIKEYRNELFDEATKAAVEYLDGQNIKYERLLRIGDPTQQICRLAKELRVKYIVIGSRGMGPIKGTVMGSVSTGVLHETKIPVLIIPQ